VLPCCDLLTAAYVIWGRGVHNILDFSPCAFTIPSNQRSHVFTYYYFFIILSGVRLSESLGTAATTGLLYQLRKRGDGGELGEMKIGSGNPNTRRKTALAPLCPPQIPHD
jgi:hypothetical protein